MVTSTGRLSLDGDSTLTIDYSGILACGFLDGNSLFGFGTSVHYLRVETTEVLSVDTPEHGFPGLRPDFAEELVRIRAYFKFGSHFTLIGMI